VRRLVLAWCVAGSSLALAGAGPVPLTAALSIDAATGESANEGAYPAPNVADDDAKTAWVANGKRLLLGFPAVKVVAMEILPGYGKSAALWSANRRVLALRYRFYPKPGEGQVSAPSTEWKTIAVPAPERFTTAGAAMVPLEIASTGEVVALELEVTEATKPTKSEDICISQVRVQASAAPPCPKGERWRYLESINGTTLEVGDRLAADFDQFDLDACTAQHEGTGGGTRTFKGTCTKVADGVRLEGTTAFFDGVGQEPGKPYRKTLKVRRFGCGLAEIDGHLYSR
jgi:hypothetical protein